MSYDLIELTNTPTLPVPFSSTTPGEAWVWDDYVFMLQCEPGIMAQALARIGGKPAPPSPMKYPYAVSVFYKKHKNPHGPSSLPIMVMSLEQPDYSAIIPLLKAKGLSLQDMGFDSSHPATVMVGLFTAEARFNLGEFTEKINEESARNFLFKKLSERLDLSGYPVKIGPLASVFGHPDTGWPPASPSVKSKSPGCLSALLMLLVPASVLFATGA